MSKITQNFINYNNKTSIVGLDIGNALLKSNIGVILDSKVSFTEPLIKTNKLVLDEQTYYIGCGNYDTTYIKSQKKNYITMLYGLLALSTNSTHNYISVGLPLGQYRENKQELISLILSNNKKVVEINDIEKTIIIDNIFVAPEGVATLTDEFQGIVIDLGGLTSDVALVINERGMRRIINPISIPTGTINLYTDFINKINSKYSLDLKIEDAERILNNGLLLDGKKEKIDFALETYRDYTENLISQLQVNYSLRTNYISCTGGGATILYEQLKNRLGEGVSLQKNSIFANANAFYELGLSVFGEE